MQGMTGVDDPYEEPSNAELILHTTGTTPQENAQRALEYLIRAGFVTR
jgi:sulfate adenylyltransferase